MEQYNFPAIEPAASVYYADQIEQFFNLPELEIITTGGKNKIAYVNTAAAYDTETTSFYDDNGEKRACVYAFMFGIHDRVILLRTWDEFMAVMMELQKKFELNYYRRLIVYVHNLPFEFTFMCRRFHWDKIFADKDKSPIVALTNTGIEFRCSLRLSGGMKLESIADPKNGRMPHYPHIRKQVGDLDYNLMRHSGTPLTEAEKGYCVYDVFVLLAWVHELIAQEKGEVTGIPLTSTGYVRRELRKRCYESYGYYDMIHRICLKDPDTYAQLERARRGGDTHGNATRIGKTFENVGHADLTSSYPAVMAMRNNYPVSSFKLIKNPSTAQFLSCMRRYACVFDVTFYEIQAKDTSADDYISRDRCMEIVGSVGNNNGRIHAAQKITTTVVDIDFQIISDSYTYSGYEIHNLRYATRGYLPLPIIQGVLGYYAAKTKLKGVAGMEVEYNQNKAKANSSYGCMVMAAVRDEYLYDDEDGWLDPKPADPIEAVKMYDKDKRRFLFYGWGVWICANARYALYTLKRELGEDYIYGDTDSAFYINPARHTTYFDRYDDGVRRKMEDMAKHYNGAITEDMYNPANNKGEHYLLGGWDSDMLLRFKTLGAKRYIMEFEKKGAVVTEITVAGLGKDKGIKYIKSQTPAGGDLFDTFSIGLSVPADSTGKLTHTYLFEEYETPLTDYYGVTETVHELSYIHLEGAPFEMNRDPGFSEFLRNIDGMKLVIGDIAHE